MADSDSEVSFESADEGEMDKKGGVNPATAKQEVDIKEADGTPKTGSHSTSSPENVEPSRTNDSKESMEVSPGSIETKGTEQPEQAVNETRTAEPGSARENDKQTAQSDSVDSSSTQEERKKGSEDATGDAKDGHKMEAEKEKEEKQIEPEGEEIRDRGSTETAEASRAGAVPEQAAPKETTGGSWGWGGWSSSILSSAAATVTKVSDNVGKGLTSVLENVESSLGVPKPEELTEIERQEAAQAAEKTKEQPEDKEQTTKESEGTEDGEEAEQGAAGIGGLLNFGASAFSNVMEKTVHGGLDALEAIGRKTMDILQEGDPRLEKKRAFVLPRAEKPNLSEVLRQAKEEAEAEASRRQEEEEHQKYNFSFLFDQYQGLVHLEALEMLSNQSETKVQSSIAIVTEEVLEDLKTELLEIRDAFQMEDVDSVEEDATNDQDFVNVVTELLFSLSVAATPDKLQRAEREAKDWLSSHSAGKTEENDEDDEELQVKNIHARALRTLAELTSRTIEQFHKVAELMLIEEEKGEEKSQSKSPMESATTLSKLASILSAEVSSIATRFCELLTSLGDQSEETSTIITTIYLEASNSTSYIQDAFQLLLPVMQDIAVRRRSTSEAT